MSKDDREATKEDLMRQNGFCKRSTSQLLSDLISMQFEYSVVVIRDKVSEAIAEALGGCAYDCDRVWSAWGCGTMSQNDFHLISENDARITELADAALRVMVRYIALPLVTELKQ